MVGHPWRWLAWGTVALSAGGCFPEPPNVCDQEDCEGGSSTGVASTEGMDGVDTGGPTGGSMGDATGSTSGVDSGSGDDPDGTDTGPQVDACEPGALSPLNLGDLDVGVTSDRFTLRLPSASDRGSLVSHCGTGAELLYTTDASAQWGSSTVQWNVWNAWEGNSGVDVVESGEAVVRLRFPWSIATDGEAGGAAGNSIYTFVADGRIFREEAFDHGGAEDPAINYWMNANLTLDADPFEALERVVDGVPGDSYVIGEIPMMTYFIYDGMTNDEATFCAHSSAGDVVGFAGRDRGDSTAFGGPRATLTNHGSPGYALATMVDFVPGMPVAAGTYAAQVMMVVDGNADGDCSYVFEQLALHFVGPSLDVEPPEVATFLDYEFGSGTFNIEVAAAGTIEISAGVIASFPTVLLSLQDASGTAQAVGQVALDGRPLVPSVDYFVQPSMQNTGSTWVLVRGPVANNTSLTIEYG